MEKALRIVSLCPSNTEIVDALGLLDSLAGVDDWSDWPLAVRTLPKVGPDQSVDIDRVAALEPDLVLASLSVPGMEKNVEALAARGLPFIVLDPAGLEGIWADIQRVADRLGVPERGRATVARLQDRVNAVKAAPRRSSLRLYWEWWPKPIYTPGRTNWLTELSEAVGCTNIFADYDVPNVRVDDPQEIIRRAPDVILLAWTGAKRPDTALVYRRPGWEAIPAVQNRHVFVMEEGLFNRPSPRLVDGLEHLARTVWGL